jgi:endonuclease YncB( thermonuclease family)
MFYFLHRLVKWVFIALIAAGLYWVWLQREMLEPVYVWYDVYDNGGIQKTNRLQVIEGKATHVLDGHTFQMTQGNKAYSVRLAGFEIPEVPLPNEERALELERRKFLRETVLMQEAKVDVTYSEGASVLGIVHVNGTNLNLYYVTNGLGKFRPAYIKALPRDMQYQFFAAKRLREKEQQQKTAFAMQAGAR